MVDLRILIEHAARTWAAEEENARRINTKRNFALTQVGVLITAIFIKFGSEPGHFSGVSGAVRFVLLLFIFWLVILVIRALLRSSTPNSARGIHASEALSMSKQEIKSNIGANCVELSILWKTVTASERLCFINREASCSVKDGQNHLSTLYSLVLVYFLFNACMIEPPKAVGSQGSQLESIEPSHPSNDKE